jgi:hypothetical protein
MEMSMEAEAHQRHLDHRSTQHILGTTLALTIMEVGTIPTAAEAAGSIRTEEAVETILMAETVAAKEVQWIEDQYKAHGETFDFSAL